MKQTKKGIVQVYGYLSNTLDVSIFINYNPGVLAIPAHRGDMQGCPDVYTARSTSCEEEDGVAIISSTVTERVKSNGRLCTVIHSPFLKPTLMRWVYVLCLALISSEWVLGVGVGSPGIYKTVE